MCVLKAADGYLLFLFRIINWNIHNISKIGSVIFYSIVFMKSPKKKLN